MYSIINLVIPITYSNTIDVTKPTDHGC